jgi:hypothetical protein
VLFEHAFVHAFLVVAYFHYQVFPFMRVFATGAGAVAVTAFMEESTEQ